MPHHAIVVPDTNALLHSQPFENLPWCDIAEADSVELVLVSQVLRELDAKKWGESEKLRSRAQRILAIIKKFVPTAQVTGTLSKGVAIRVYMPTPNQRDGLELADPDDRIIAAALDLAEPSSPIIVSGDITLGYKAQAAGIRILSIPDRFQFREVRTSKKPPVIPHPILIPVVCSEDPSSGEPVEQQLNFCVNRGINADHLLRHAKERMEEARQRDEAEELEQRSFNSGAPSWHEIARSLNSNVLSWMQRGPGVEEWERYHLELIEYQRRHANAFLLWIGFRNDGDAPADDVQIEFEFPNTVAVARGKPVAPRRPTEGALSLDAGYILHAPQAGEPPDRIQLEYDTDPIVARITAKRLMHSRRLLFPILCNVLEDTCRGMSIPARLLSAVPPLRSESKYNIRWS